MDETESPDSEEPSRPPYLACALLLLMVVVVAGAGVYVFASVSTHTAAGARAIAHPAGKTLVSVSFSERDEVRALDSDGRPWLGVDDELQVQLSATFSGPYYAFERVAESGSEVGMLRTAGGVNFIRRGVGSSDGLNVAGDRLALDGDWAALASVASDTVSLCLKTDGGWAMTGVTATVTPARGGGCESLALGIGLLAVGNGRGQVTVFDLETQELVAELSPPAEVKEGARTIALDFSEDGKELAAALERHLVVWDLGKEEVVLHAPIDGAPLTTVAVGGGGAYVVGDNAGALTGYDRNLRSGHALYFPYEPEPPLRPVAPVRSIAFSGWRFAWCVNDQLFVFDIRTLPLRMIKGGKTIPPR